MAYIQIENVKKEFKNKNNSIKVLDGISFGIRKGEFITIFGPNGCGKTTLLKILSNFDNDYSGKIKINKYLINKIKSYIVFQNPNDSLFNWMTVKENIELGLFNIKLKSVFYQIYVGGKRFSEFKNFYPYQLSAGLKQLTVISRAFVYNPNLLLLDEPFSSIDYKTSLEFEDLLLKIWRKTKQTIIFVSHNIDEAIYLADKVIIFSNPPTKIKKIINIKLSRPRNQKIKCSQEFQKIKREILECFYENE